jgi:recombination protein RecA
MSMHGIAGVSTVSALAHVRDTPAWDLASLTGRLVELSGLANAARLTAAFGLVVEAQRRTEPAAWITLRASFFFPPDAAAGGVDLRALPVVRVADARAAGRAADHLVRSGSFGLVVLDLGACDRRDSVPIPSLTRIQGLANKHDTVVVLLTEKSPNAPSRVPWCPCARRRSA